MLSTASLLLAIGASEARLGLTMPALVHQEQLPERAAETSAVTAVELRVEGAGQPEWLPRPRAAGAWWGGFGWRTLALAPRGVEARQEWQLDSAIAYAPAPGWPAVGLGAWLRRETGPDVWRHWLIGPELVARGHTALGHNLIIGGVADWHLEWRAAVAPWVATGAEATISGLSAARWRFSLGKDAGPLRLAIGYQRWWLGGGGYHELFAGPFVRLSVEDLAWRSAAP